MPVRKILFSLICLALLQPATATDKNNPLLAAALIPDSISLHADAVVRFRHTTMNILSDKKIIIRYYYAVTILRKRGLPQGYFSELYDKDIHLSGFSGAVYNAMGQRTKKLGVSDLDDISAVSGGTLYRDDRKKVYRPVIRDFPATVEYEYEVTYDGALNYPPWIPQDDYLLGVERSVFTVIAPPELLPRYKNVRLDKPKVSRMQDKTVWRWQVNALLPVRHEPLSEDLIDRVPVLYLAPAQFRYAHTQGNVSSWAGFGRWIASLNAGERDLPPATVTKIREMTQNAAGTEEKARIVYDYMQKHTRYVSVQLGIGGYKPYPASYVDEKGYGDCKALCNYTCALMEAAGIDARYVLVRSGDVAGDILCDFPSNQFDHVIVCIPQKKDSVWLECTSQTQPFGFPGRFTADRHALMIAGDSGVLVHTPVYGPEMNLQNRHAVLTLENDGTAQGKIHTHYTGLQYESVEGALLLKGDDLKKWYYHHLNLPSYELTSIRLSESETGTLPVADEELSLSVKKWMISSGKRKFLPLNLLNRNSWVPKQLHDRETDIVLSFPYIDTDTITWILPAYLSVEYLPSPVQVKSKFGEYACKVTQDGNRITYIRRMRINKGKYPPEMFGELSTFLKQVTKGDRQKALLKML